MAPRLAVGFRSRERGRSPPGLWSILGGRRASRHTPRSGTRPHLSRDGPSGQIRPPPRPPRSPGRHPRHDRIPTPANEPMTTEATSLPSGVVFVREGRLDVSPRAVAAARRLLSADERARADRFAYDRHRRRYTVAQGHLRRALGRLTGAPPASLRFQYGRKGKPHLPGGPSFNQSHSGERLMIAVAASGRLGIDIEELRPVRRMLGISDKHFAPSEAARMRAAGSGERQSLFFRIWTRKEAFLKALGVGTRAPAAVLFGGPHSGRGAGTPARGGAAGGPRRVARRGRALLGGRHGGVGRGRGAG